MEERRAAGKADVENSPELCTEQSKELPFFNCFTGNYSARMLDSAWALFYGHFSSFSSESRQSSPGAWTPRLEIFMLMRSLSFLLEAVFLNSLPSDKIKGSKLGGGGLNSHLLSVTCWLSCSHSHSNWTAPSVSLSQSEDPQSPRNTQRARLRQKKQRAKESEGEGGVCLWSSIPSLCQW